MMMASFNRTRCRAAAILFLVVASAVGSSSGIISKIGRTLSTASKVPASVISHTSDLRRATSRLTTTGNFKQAVKLIGDISENLDKAFAQTARPRVHVPSAKPFKLKEINLRLNHQLRPWEISSAEVFKKSIPTRASLVNTQTEDSIGSEKEEDDETFRAEDLLAPITESASLLLQLMNLSTQNLDRTFRVILKNQSPIVQNAQSFNGTLLQISQKLDNSFQNSIINVQRIKMHSLFMSSKVNESTGYLIKKFDNSSRMVGFLYLPLKNLKETTDQTFNLSSQIANDFGELVPLADDVIQSHNFSKSIITKEQQVRNTTTEIYSTNQEKKKMDTEIILIQKEIENLKQQKQLDEEEFYKAMDNLNDLQYRGFDEFQCHWAYNWKTAKYQWWNCPLYNPDPTEISRVNQTVQAAKIKLEKTIESLYSAEEEETAKKREVDNELEIRIERLNHELHQLNEDVQLLRNTSDLLSRLAKCLETVDKNWKKFVAICGNLQSGATKSFNIVEEANHTSANNRNNELSESILFNLRKTEENLSLIEIVTDIYLKKSKKNITEIV